MASQVEKKQISPKNSSRANEIVAVVVLTLTVLLFLSLVTHSPTDPSLNTSSALKTQNWIGVVGAVLSDLLFQAIGTTAYFLPFLLGLIAWRIFRSESLYAPLSRIVGYFLFVFSASGLLSLIGLRGGVLGVSLTQFFSYLIGTLGAGILLTALFLTAVLLITNLSYLSFISNLPFTIGYFDILRKRFRAWREDQKQKAAERMERRLEKRSEKNPGEKESTKKPTISIGETAPASLSETLTKAKKKSAVAAANGSKISAKTETVSPALAEEESDFVEEILPTISTAEEPVKTIQVNEELPVVLDAETENIPISPIKGTGDLDASLVEETEEIEEEIAPVETKQPPQNFDNYVLPTTDFLTSPPPRLEQKEEELLAIAQELTEKSKEFNVTGRVMHICQGPVVTTYEFKPDPGVKYSRITGLADDLCLALKAESIRIDRIPGKAYVGIEVPNRERETIHLREVIESKKFRESNSLLTIALGKTIDGLNYIADLAKMPHLLIAGATGAGKSVGVNSLIVSILYKARPDEVKFIMVDPKRLELGLYADIPHLATPIITDPKRAAISLKWAVSEMEKRYKDLAGWGVRNIDGFNAEVKKRNAAEHFDDNGEPWKPLPYIVIIIDELADLMMVSGKEVEESITRLAQMARAVGIHLVLATQRPSVDVITGLIKANFPSRISFRVSSKVDSRTIIDSNGAERLLGKGDMLFLPPGTSQIVRVHGGYVDEKEIARIVEQIKEQGKPEYDTTITKTEEELDDSAELPGRKDPLFLDALRSVVSAKRASTSLLQRHLRIGYGRAAAILDAMVREGYIGEMDGSTRARPILQKAYDDLQEAEEGREI
jgi:DNA segregation ATPase FtsK/SpoIIIE, S-DNA-T family